MEYQDGFAATSAGRLHFHRRGQGAPLLLMHSNGRSAHEFDALAASLADRFDVVAWDMPGHGDSDRLRTRLSVIDYGRAALELAAAVFDAPPIIGGGSIGAVIALATAAAHPQAVAGVVPIELPVARDGAWWAAHWGMVETMFTSPDEPVAAIQARYRAPDEAFVARLRVDRHKAGGRSMMSVLWAGREAADGMLADIAALKVPALFVNGARGLAPDARAVIDDLSPGAGLTIVADSGHFPHSDDPQAVAAAIRSSFGADRTA